MGYDRAGNAYPLHKLWNRRHTTKFNGVSYPVQRAAAAIYTAAGQAQVRELSDYYLRNAALIRQTLKDLGYACVGGENSPYIWVETGTDSWAFFDLMLQQAQVVITPGAGFGTCGQGYIRISAFNDHAKVQEAMTRLQQVLPKR
jgi:LL-diaminopimelate aminotransferase